MTIEVLSGEFLPPAARGRQAVPRLWQAVQRPCHACSFDYFVGARQKVAGNAEAELLGSLEIQDQIELSRLQHRQVGGLRPFEDTANVDASIAICVCKASAITH